MIDKPKGRIERFLNGLYEWCNYLKEEFSEILEAGMEPVEVHRKAHPKAARIIRTCTCMLFCGLMIAGFAAPKTVIVKTDDSRGLVSTVYETTSTRVDSFLENHDIDYVFGEDIIDVEMYDAIRDEMCINIIKAYDVKVIADGEEYTYHTLSTTAGDVLDALDISVAADDIVEPSEDTIVRKDDVIVVKRVTTKEITETEIQDFDVRYTNDSSLAIGSKEVTQKGRKGKVEKTYLVGYVDGVKTSKKLIDTKVIKKKRDKIISYGTKILSGIPEGLGYKKKISGVRAVSYNFGGNPRGSYGLPCTYGTCAVDPDLIPLGSLLYIEGYGYAVANDVGSAIKGKTVDVYMEKLSQCGLWGARTTNVYLIRSGS